MPTPPHLQAHQARRGDRRRARHARHGRRADARRPRALAGAHHGRAGRIHARRIFAHRAPCHHDASSHTRRRRARGHAQPRPGRLALRPLVRRRDRRPAGPGTARHPAPRVPRRRTVDNHLRRAAHRRQPHLHRDRRARHRHKPHATREDAGDAGDPRRPPGVAVVQRGRAAPPSCPLQRRREPHGGRGEPRLREHARGPQRGAGRDVDAHADPRRGASVHATRHRRHAAHSDGPRATRTNGDARHHDRHRAHSHRGRATSGQAAPQLGVLGPLTVRGSHGINGGPTRRARGGHRPANAATRRRTQDAPRPHAAAHSRRSRGRGCPGNGDPSHTSVAAQTLAARPRRRDLPTQRGRRHRTTTAPKPRRLPRRPEARRGPHAAVAHATAPETGARRARARYAATSRGASRRGAAAHPATPSGRPRAR